MHVEAAEAEGRAGHAGASEDPPEAWAGSDEDESPSQPPLLDPRTPRPMLAAVVKLRAEIHSILDALGISDKRPNALSASDLQLLFRALHEGRGIVFLRVPGMKRESAV